MHIPSNPVGTLFRNILTERCRRNPRYSLRSFARDLSISPQRLSHLINGKKGLSLSAASELATKLGLTAEERDHFLCLVEAHHARSPRDRAKAQERLAITRITYQNVPLDHFKPISDWYPLAIKVLCQLERVKNDEHEIARRLGISVTEAKTALEGMYRIGMMQIDPDGYLASPADVFVHSNGAGSADIRNYHERSLSKASQALTEQGLGESDFSQMYFGLDQARLPEMKEFIANFRKEFARRFHLHEEKERSEAKAPALYSLNTQLFKITLLSEDAIALPSDRTTV